MTYRNFINPRNLLMEVGKVLKTEIVSCIETETTFSSHLRCLDVWCDSFGRILGIVRRKSLGVEFHTVGTYLRSLAHHLWYSIHKE